MSSPAITPYHFAILRIGLGAYLCLYFIAELMYVVAGGCQASSPSGELFPQFGSMPPFFAPTLGPALTSILNGVGCLLSCGLCLGWRRRWVALALTGVLLALMNGQALVAPSGILCILLLLVFMAIIQSGEPLSSVNSKPDWGLPNWVYMSLFFALMGVYTSSGFFKLQSVVWTTGSVVNGALELPPSLAQITSWALLGLELVALPLMFWKAVRPYLWTVLGTIGLLTVSLFGSGPLAYGVLVMHLFCFDSRWLAPAPMSSAHPVVFFDGVCNLCNTAVDFILCEDQAQRFHFAATQSQAAQAVDSDVVRAGESMALQEGNTLHIQSDAVLRVAAGLGGLWRVLSWLRHLPRPLRNAGYFWVQKNRYRLFGRRDTCRLPTPIERARFLP